MDCFVPNEEWIKEWNEQYFFQLDDVIETQGSVVSEKNSSEDQS